MKIHKKFSVLFAASLLAAALWAAPKKVVASTSWAAAFADIAGADEIESIAPVNLRHPPEYEITVSDVQKISESEIFIFAGFERMMKTLGTKVPNKGVSVQIVLDNSLATVKESTLKIAQELGTEDIQKARYAEYEKLVKDGQKKALKKKLNKKKVLCNKNQTYLAKELGLEIAAVFGPGPVSAEELLEAKKAGYDLIIDNIHNPTGKPVTEILPKAKYIEWRNFPTAVEHDALKKVVKDNIDLLLAEF
ncbi:MAG: zinc ABC transporter substrate-binding protein [Treponema sp.]|nr:zinc ABC transporter substrate-binding protein [Treponema sp.]